MESAVCNYCGSSSAVSLCTPKDLLFGKGDRFEIVRCRQCDLVYVSPRPRKEEMGEYYPHHYQDEILVLIDRLKTQPVLRLGLEMLKKRRTPPLAPPAVVLDIGCSYGDYLAYLKKNGWQVEGIEIDSQAALHARDAGLTVHHGDAEVIVKELPSETFDVVTMWHVLEHLHDPMGVLQEIHRILKPNGHILMELPNFSSLLAPLFGQYWYPLEVPRHLYHFTAVTITKMLVKAGFTTHRIKGIASPEAILWSLRIVKNRLLPPVRDTASHALAINPFMAALWFPLTWCLAQAGRSDHMAVSAQKGVSPS